MMLVALIPVPAQASTTHCGKVRSVQDSYTFDGRNYGHGAKHNTVRTEIFYKLCKNSEQRYPYIRSMGMQNTYNVEGFELSCGIIFPFKGVKWTLYFNDVNGRNFTKKVDIGCDGDTVGSKFTDLTNQPRLYVYDGDHGYARWHGTATEKWGMAIPDRSTHLSGKFATRL